MIQHILITTQKKQDVKDPKASNLFRVGVLAKIIQTVKLTNYNAKILVEVTNRVKFTNINGEDMFILEFVIVPDKEVADLDMLNDTTMAAMESYHKQFLHDTSLLFNHQTLELETYF